MDGQQKHRRLLRLCLVTITLALLAVFVAGPQASPPRSEPVLTFGLWSGHTHFGVALADGNHPVLGGHHPVLGGKEWPRQLSGGGPTPQTHGNLSVWQGTGRHPVIEASVTGQNPLHDCASCHEGDAVLSETHPPTAGMSMNDCRACHVPDGPLSLEGKLSLSHTHILSGVGCAACHENTDPPEDPGTALCLACHGPLETLAAKTADVSPTNPHESPHGPPFAECSLCHLQHEPSENFCSTCHDFNFNLP